ncbi:MAG: hypothetical protein ACRDWH_09095 [Acidimicrobiia bacterium]
MVDESPAEREPEPVAATPTPASDSGVSWAFALFLLVGLGFVTFAVQNMADVAVKFVVWEFTVALPVLLGVTALIAVIADEVVGVARRRRRRLRIAEKEELERFRRS